MNKPEILEHYYSSLHKWEEILSRVKNDNAPDGGYEQEYWKACGFCLAHDCMGLRGRCPLNVGIYRNRCGAIGIVLHNIDSGTKKKSKAISEISSFIKLIEKIISETDQGFTGPHDKDSNKIYVGDTYDTL